jgi:hypothetical protein
MTAADHALRDPQGCPAAASRAAIQQQYATCAEAMRRRSSKAIEGGANLRPLSLVVVVVWWSRGCPGTTMCSAASVEAQREQHDVGWATRDRSPRTWGGLQAAPQLGEGFGVSGSTLGGRLVVDAHHRNHGRGRRAAVAV